MAQPLSVLLSPPRLEEPSLLQRASAVVLLLILYYAIQFPSAWLALQNPFGFPESWVESGAWLYMIVHHVAQMLLALLVIGLLGGWRYAEWGLNLDKFPLSLGLVRRFTFWFGLFILVGTALQLAFGSAGPPRSAPLSPAHVAGGLFFMWVVSGVSEEVLFRGMMQTFLARFWRSQVRLPGVEVSTAGLVTALIFTAVHVNFDVRTLEITHLSLPQLAIAFVLGIFYAVAYERTGSLLAPALAHNISNGLMESANLALALAQR